MAQPRFVDLANTVHRFEAKFKPPSGSFLHFMQKPPTKIPKHLETTLKQKDCTLFEFNATGMTRRSSSSTKCWPTPAAAAATATATAAARYAEVMACTLGVLASVKEGREDGRIAFACPVSEANGNVLKSKFILEGVGKMKRLKKSVLTDAEVYEIGRFGEPTMAMTWTSQGGELSLCTVSTKMILVFTVTFSPYLALDSMPLTPRVPMTGNDKYLIGAFGASFNLMPLNLQDFTTL
ncbi:unnamed protein product [Taenia asiatica]|uniref:Transducin/WD40 repeat-like superfamily protein n=1 Tax=Taenia asiatica TaxID=60517 RepID=A0A0R3W2X8_TAEAS|nr:unnamed protein product [Taenia asiatica]